MRGRSFSTRIQDKNIVLTIPDTCPHCNTVVFMKYINGALLPVKFQTEFIQFCAVAVYECPSADCLKQCFVVYSTNKPMSPNQTNYITTPIMIYPAQYDKQKYDFWEKISPEAVKSYNQAIEAEGMGLDTLVGIGLRRSLDCLMYDVGEMFFPEHSEFNNNPKTTLKQRIDRYINDDTMKTLASACSWLRNDFTHPIRRYEGFSLDELKTLIKQMFSYMDCFYSGKNALKSLNTNNPGLIQP